MPNRLTDEQARANVAEWTDGKFMSSIPYPGSREPWPGVCMDCGQPVSPSHANLQKGRGHCVYCAGQRVDDAVAVGKMMAAGLTPLDPYPGGSKRPWKCQCDTCGAVVQPHYSAIQQGYGGCDGCGYQATAVALATPKPGRSLADLHPEIAAEADGWDPSTVKPGSNQRKQWKCSKCGHEWGADVRNRTGQGQGCPACAEYGFKPDQPGSVYVVASERWLKVGISNSIETRLAKHRRQGLTEVLHTITFESGHDARALEDLWMEYRASLPEFLHPTKADIKDGWTEAVRRTGNALAWIENHLLPVAV